MSVEVDLMNPKLKAKLVQRAESKVREMMKKFPELEDYDIRKSCLLYAAAIISAANEIGNGLQHLQIQGGTASWRIVPDHLDDGISPTHYSYVWSAGPGWLDMIVAGDQMPEVHFWCAVHPRHDPVGRGLVVDLTTQYVPFMATQAGLNPACSPPKVVWCRPDELPENVTEYRPDYHATRMGYSLLTELMKGKR